MLSPLDDTDVYMHHTLYTTIYTHKNVYSHVFRCVYTCVSTCIQCIDIVLKMVRTHMQWCMRWWMHQCRYGVLMSVFSSAWTLTREHISSTHMQPLLLYIIQRGTNKQNKRCALILIRKFSSLELYSFSKTQMIGHVQWYK